MSGGIEPLGTPIRYDCKVYLNTIQNVSNGTADIVEWEAEEFDNGGFWVVGTPSRLTVPTGLGGLYEVGYCLGTDDNVGDGVRWQTAALKNGSEIKGSRCWIGSSGSGNRPTVCASVPVEATDGQYFECYVDQLSGSVQRVNLTSAFWCRKIG